MFPSFYLQTMEKQNGMSGRTVSGIRINKSLFGTASDGQAVHRWGFHIIRFFYRKLIDLD